MDNNAARFLALHRAKPGFIMPNAWDAGSARVLAAAGFAAIATTSAGIAFSLGRQDYVVDRNDFGVPRQQMFARMREIVEAVEVPVNGDLEAGYGDRPEDVAETIRLAIEAGLAGGNIEDKRPFEPALYDETLAVERIVAARETIASLKSSFVLTARSDAIIWSKGGVADAIWRSNRYLAAGADCTYTPGASDLPTLATLSREIDGPLNMVMGLGNADGNAREWLAAGVQRISLGGSIARSALGLIHRAAEELRNHGTIAFARAQLAQQEINRLFGRVRP